LLVKSPFDLFALQTAEERFSYRVIPAIASTTLAWAQKVVFAPTIESANKKSLHPMVEAFGKLKPANWFLFD
jgi:hypothetical protein